MSDGNAGDIGIAVGLAEEWCRSVSSRFATSVDLSGRSTREVDRLLSEAGCLHGTVWEALVWLRVGQIARAHEIVQDAGSGIEAYIHGMIHRLEGDYWNAKYWFRTAGRRTVDSVVRHVAEQSEGSRLLSSIGFDPVVLVDSLERLHREQNHSSRGPASSPNSTAASKQRAVDAGNEISEQLGQEWWAVWSLCKP